jgi:hypothetical protein
MLIRLDLLSWSVCTRSIQKWGAGSGDMIMIATLHASDAYAAVNVPYEAVHMQAAGSTYQNCVLAQGCVFSLKFHAPTNPGNDSLATTCT